MRKAMPMKAMQRECYDGHTNRTANSAVISQYKYYVHTIKYNIYRAIFQLYKCKHLDFLSASIWRWICPRQVQLPFLLPPHFLRLIKDHRIFSVTLNSKTHYLLDFLGTYLRQLQFEDESPHFRGKSSSHLYPLPITKGQAKTTASLKRVII